MVATSRQQDSPREGELAASQAAEPQRTILPEHMQHPALLQQPVSDGNDTAQCDVTLAEFVTPHSLSL